MTNTEKIIIQICTIHKTVFVKGSQLQQDHELESDIDCKWKKYNPKKDNPKYKESEIMIPDDEENKNDSKKVYEFAQSKIIKKVRSAGDHNRVYALVKIRQPLQNNRVRLLGFYTMDKVKL